MNRRAELYSRPKFVRIQGFRASFCCPAPENYAASCKPTDSNWASTKKILERRKGQKSIVRVYYQPLLGYACSCVVRLGHIRTRTTHEKGAQRYVFIAKIFHLPRNYLLQRMTTVAPGQLSFQKLENCSGSRLQACFAHAWACSWARRQTAKASKIPAQSLRGAENNAIWWYAGQICMLHGWRASRVHMYIHTKTLKIQSHRRIRGFDTIIFIRWHPSSQPAGVRAAEYSVARTTLIV